MAAKFTSFLSAVMTLMSFLFFLSRMGWIMFYQIGGTKNTSAFAHLTGAVCHCLRFFLRLRLFLQLITFTDWWALFLLLHTLLPIKPRFLGTRQIYHMPLSRHGRRLHKLTRIFLLPFFSKEFHFSFVVFLLLLDFFLIFLFFEVCPFRFCQFAIGDLFDLVNHFT